MTTATTTDAGRGATDAARGFPEGDGRDSTAESGAPGETSSSTVARADLGYHPALDGIRALAVLAVIAYHLNYSWAQGGFLGVDTFFVLSGFLITTLLVLEHRRGRTIRLAAFWARRARRLLPALLLVLCFAAIYARFVVVPWERAGIRKDMLASLFYVANWRFIADKQDYFSLFSAPSPLRHMWSLAIEEQYYLVWPIVALACLGLAKGRVRLLAAVAAVGAVASVIAMRVRYTPSDPTVAYYATDSRAHSLLIGALLALAFVVWTPSRRVASYLAGLGVLALLGVLIAFATTSGTDPNYYRGGSAVFAVGAAALVAGAMQPGLLSRALAVRPLVWIGRISYGLYLWHWPIIVWLVPSRLDLGPTALNGVRVALTFAAAIASYHLAEKWVRARSWRPVFTFAAAAPAVGVVAVVILFAGSGGTPPPSYLAGAAPDPAAFTAPGDTPPPQFIWGYGDPLLCGEPRPEETAEATRAAQQDPPLTLPATAAGQHVLLIGDSTACSMWPGLRAVGDVQGLATDQGSVFGCGIAIDEFTSTRNEPVTPNTQRCRPFLDWAIPRALARSNPNVVIWMSSWEKQDLVVDGRTIVAGTPEWENEVQHRMDVALAELTAHGARVVMVTEAAQAPNPAEGTESYDRSADDASYGRLNGLLRRFAARHPDDVSIVDLASAVCPDGPPCPEDVDGMHARPDGRHFTPTSAVWAARYVLAQAYGGRPS